MIPKIPNPQTSRSQAHLTGSAMAPGGKPRAARQFT